MDEIPGPDDFNFGQDEVANPYEINDNNNNDKKKDDLNFGLSSPIGNNHFNFDGQSNLSLGNQIKKKMKKINILILMEMIPIKIMIN